MIQVFTGANDYIRKQKVDEVTSGFIKTYGDISFEKIDASEIDFGRLLDRVSTQPFLVERRMILLRQIASNKDLAAGIEQFLDSVSDSTDVLIEEQKFDKRLTLFKTLKKRTDFHEFKELDERNLSSWITQEVTNRGGKLNKNDASYLVQLSGTNQMALSHEIDKLLSYDQHVTRQTIDKLVEPLPAGTTFQLLDAAFEGDQKRALELYDLQRLQQVEPQAIMGLITWQVHILAIVKANDKLSTEDIVSKSRLSPYVVRKAQDLVRHKSQADIKHLVSKTVLLDSRMKSEMLDADDAVRHYILSI